MASKDIAPEKMEIYRKYFIMYDLNGDGVISARELKKVSKQLGYRLSDRQIRDIMHARDLDESGSLSFDEFLLAMPANLAIPEEEHKLAEIRLKFQEYDRDGSGTVSADEAHAILARELAFSKQQSVDLLKKYDKNNDGMLDYEEFIRFYGKVKAKAEQIQNMFKEFDKDNSGAVSVDEAKLMLRRLGMTDSDIENLVATHDKNKDGELQYEEFISFVLNN